MTTLFGALGINDSDRIFLQTLGQQVIYDAVNMLLMEHNADLAAAEAVFIEGTTSDFKFRYKLPGGGRLQRRGRQAPSGSVKAGGEWDIALPLEDFGAQISASDIDFAYMTAQDLDRHLKTVRQQDLNTRRYEILYGLLNNTERSHVDQTGRGTLAIEPLANGDAVLYPPVLGSESEATDDHYLESGYAASAISDTNNPYATGADELEEHFGAPTGGSNIVAFINNAQVAKTRALTDFVPVSDMGIDPGQDTPTISGLPEGLPGRVLGRMDGAGVWVSEWRWVPANYMVFIHLDAPKPLMKRIDPAETGLGMGLQLVATNDAYPFTSAHYRNRFGLGCGNRLNGVILELGTGGTYSIPTGYS